MQRPVLWDSQGVRDVLQELNDAHVDVRGITDMRLSHVWSGKKLRVHGTCNRNDSFSLLFFAELPVR